MYLLEYEKASLKELKNIDKPHAKFILDSLKTFADSFSYAYEKELMKSGKIKKLQGEKEVFYRLRLRSYRVIYKKEDDKLIILIVSIRSRENAYKK